MIGHESGALLAAGAIDASPSAPAGDSRLSFIDALRGFALLGVFWANLYVFAGLAFMTDDQRHALFTSRADDVAYGLELFFIENKFMGLFSFLFGLSFWLFLSRVGRREVSPVRLFYRRIGWLFVIGAAHAWLLWCFDILRFYALWATLLPLAAALSPRRLLVVGFAASVFVPALFAAVAVHPHSSEPAISPDTVALAVFSSGTYLQVLSANWMYDWFLTLSLSQLAYQTAVFGRLLLGLYAARTLALHDLRRHRTLLRWTCLVGVVAGCAGGVVFAGDLLPVSTAGAAFVRRVVLEAGFLGATLGYASGLAWLSLHARTARWIAAMAPMGRMALTWYLCQTAFGLLLFYGFTHGPALIGHVPPARLCLLAVAGYAGQLAVARAWMRRFRFGPAEWAWRSLTYGERQPFRRSAVSTSIA